MFIPMLSMGYNGNLTISGINSVHIASLNINMPTFALNTCIITMISLTRIIILKFVPRITSITR